MQGGSAPPAFQRAEKKRLEEESKEKGLVLWEGEDNTTSGKLTIKGRGGGQGRGRGRDFRGKGKRKRKWLDGCESNIESDAEDAVEEPTEMWKGSGKGRGRGRGRGQGRGRGRGRNQPEVEESEEDSDMDVPLASALPLSSKPPHKLLTNEPVVIPTVKKDSKAFVSEGSMERVREDGSTAELDESVPVPVLEKRQLEILCVNPICSPEGNCVNGDTVGEAVIEREGDEKQVVCAARDEDWLDNDADTLSDIDDDEVCPATLKHTSCYR